MLLCRALDIHGHLNLLTDFALHLMGHLESKHLKSMSFKISNCCSTGKELKTLKFSIACETSILSLFRLSLEKSLNLTLILSWSAELTKGIQQKIGKWSANGILITPDVTGTKELVKILSIPVAEEENTLVGMFIRGISDWDFISSKNFDQQ